MKSETKSGTNIEEVKRLNNKSGLSYNQVKQKVLNAYLEKQKNSKDLE